MPTSLARSQDARMTCQLRLHAQFGISSMGRAASADRWSLTTVSPLQERALREVMVVRRGEIRSYSWIARAIGAPLAARAVGDAWHATPFRCWFRAIALFGRTTPW